METSVNKLFFRSQSVHYIIERFHCVLYTYSIWCNYCDNLESFIDSCIYCPNPSAHVLCGNLCCGEWVDQSKEDVVRALQPCDLLCSTFAIKSLGSPDKQL